MNASASSKVCLYCERAAASDGSTIHAGGCRGLHQVGMTVLKYDADIVSKDAEIERLTESLNANITVSKARDAEVQRLTAALTVCQTYDYRQIIEESDRLRAKADLYDWLVADADRCASIVADAYGAWDGENHEVWMEFLGGEIAFQRVREKHARAKSAGETAGDSDGQ